MVRLLALRTGYLYPQEISLSRTQGHSVEELSKRKIRTAPSGIKPATLWLLAQCFNQLPLVVNIRKQNVLVLCIIDLFQIEADSTVLKGNIVASRITPAAVS